MAVVLTPPTSLRPYTSTSVTATGAAATTAYVLTVNWPHGTTQKIPATSDGSGNLSFPLVPQPGGSGTPSYSVRPAAEFQGTTTPAATATTGVQPTGS